MGFGGISVWQLVIILIAFLLTLIAASAVRADGRNESKAADAGASNAQSPDASSPSKTGKE